MPPVLPQSLATANSALHRTLGGEKKPCKVFTKTQFYFIKCIKTKHLRINYSKFVHLPALLVHLVFFYQALYTVFFQTFTRCKSVMLPGIHQRRAGAHSDHSHSANGDSFTTCKVPIPNWKQQVPKEESQFLFGLFETKRLV